jgi:hypothetical protein
MHSVIAAASKIFELLKRSNYLVLWAKVMVCIGPVVMGNEPVRSKTFGC